MQSITCRLCNPSVRTAGHNFYNQIQWTVYFFHDTTGPSGHSLLIVETSHTVGTTPPGE